MHNATCSQKGRSAKTAISLSSARRQFRAMQLCETNVQNHLTRCIDSTCSRTRLRRTPDCLREKKPDTNEGRSPSQVPNARLGRCLRRPGYPDEAPSQTVGG